MHVYVTKHDFGKRKKSLPKHPKIMLPAKIVGQEWVNWQKMKFPPSQSEYCQFRHWIYHTPKTYKKWNEHSIYNKSGDMGKNVENYEHKWPPIDHLESDIIRNITIGFSIPLKPILWTKTKTIFNTIKTFMLLGSNYSAFSTNCISSIRRTHHIKVSMYCA